MGKIIENFIVYELKKQITWSKTRPEMYHFRTTGGQEVDIILENRQGQIIGIEIKSSERVSLNDFKGLIYLKENAASKFLKGIVLYTGSQIVPFGDNLWAVPISSLWQV